jgi:ParB family transcriptional regulator, chromosome partitioning protein
MSLRLPTRFERWRMDRLRPAARNARRHDESQIQRIAESMRHYGWTAPLLIDPTGEIIAGEARWKAGQLLGQAEAPVIVIDGLTEAQREAYRVADNRLAEYATWDEDMLAEILAELQTLEFDLGDTGLSEEDLQRILAQAPEVTFPELRSGDRDPFQKMTFTLHDEQVEIVKSAMDAIADRQDLASRLNANKNGNAIAAICQAYLDAVR